MGVELPTPGIVEVLRYPNQSFRGRIAFLSGCAGAVVLGTAVAQMGAEFESILTLQRKWRGQTYQHILPVHPGEAAKAASLQPPLCALRWGCGEVGFAGVELYGLSDRQRVYLATALTNSHNILWLHA